MKVIVSGKNIRLTPRLREHATERMTAVQKFFDHINEIDLVLSDDKHKTSESNRHAEAVVWADGNTFKAKCSSNDFTRPSPGWPRSWRASSASTKKSEGTIATGVGRPRATWPSED